jgi:uncharacterized protein DUF4399
VRHIRHRLQEVPALGRSERALLAASLALVLAGCSGDDEEASPTMQPATAVETVDEQTASARKVEIASPRDGATVSAPVVLEVRATGFELHEPDGDTSGKTGHLHALLDEEQLPPAEQVIPSSPETVDFWAERVTLPGLPPGRHTLLVVASDGYRVPFSPPVFDRVTVRVHP